MTILLTLPAAVEEKLKEEAARRGITPEMCAMQIFVQHLLAGNQTADVRVQQLSGPEHAARMQAMFDQWQAEEEAIDAASKELALHSPVDIMQRIETATSLDDLFAAANAIPESDDDYDLLKALDDNRRGERPLFPPELKGVTCR